MRHGAAASEQKLVQVRGSNHFCKRHAAGASMQLAVPINSYDVLPVAGSLHLRQAPGVDWLHSE